MIDRSLKMYGMGRPDTSRGMMEDLTVDKSKAEAEAVYRDTKKKAEEKAYATKKKVNMDADRDSGAMSPAYRQDMGPVSRALNQVTK